MISRTLKILKPFLRSRFISGRPFILSHLVTTACNCKCKICLWRKPSEDEMTAEEVCKFYSDARQNGFIGTIIWGGEPLFRRDIDHILRHSKRIGLLTSMITNGYFLPDLAPQISRYIDVLLVSIDHPSKYHDVMRGREGVYDNALKGIQLVRKYNPRCKLIINTILSVFNYNKVQELIVMAKDLGVAITFGNMDFGMVKDGDGMISNRYYDISQEQRNDIFDLIERHKERGYPVNNSKNYLRHFKNHKKDYRCHYHKVLLVVYANGDIKSCLEKGRVLFNVRQAAIGELLNSPVYKKFLKKCEKCNRCNDIGVIDCSYIYSLNPGSIWNVLTHNLPLR